MELSVSEKWVMHENKNDQKKQESRAEREAERK